MAEGFIGEVRMLSFPFPPRGWAHANGQSLPVLQNPTLYSLYGNTYGGDANNFNLPDVQGRVVIGVTRAYPRGNSGGFARHTLTEFEMPVHTHLLQGSKADGNTQVPGNNMFATTPSQNQMYHSLDSGRVAMNVNSLAVTGVGAPHENMMPYLPVSFCVCINGLIPPRE